MRNSSKQKAIELRRLGQSLPEIHRKLSVPKSTLSNWFKDVELTFEQREVLKIRWKNGLIKAQQKATFWHKEQKSLRLLKAKSEATEVLTTLDCNNKNQIELALAILYLAEGSKKNTETAIGSSDELTLRFFLSAMHKIFDYDKNLARYEIYARADQNPEDLKLYWSKTLGVKIDRFKQVSIDKRSIGKTYENYWGVCSIRCGTVAIQRRLVYLAKEYFLKISNI